MSCGRCTPTCGTRSRSPIVKYPLQGTIIQLALVSCMTTHHANLFKSLVVFIWPVWHAGSRVQLLAAGLLERYVHGQQHGQHRHQQHAAGHSMAQKSIQASCPGYLLHTPLSVQRATSSSAAHDTANLCCICGVRCNTCCCRFGSRRSPRKAGAPAPSAALCWPTHRLSKASWQLRPSTSWGCRAPPQTSRQSASTARGRKRSHATTLALGC